MSTWVISFNGKEFVLWDADGMEVARNKHINPLRDLAFAKGADCIKHNYTEDHTGVKP